MYRKIWMITISLLVLQLFGSYANSADRVKQLGTVDGQAIDIKDLSLKEYKLWYERAKALYDIEKRYFNNYSYHKVVDMEAQNEGLSKNEYLRTRVYSTIPGISEKEVTEYIEKNKNKYTNFLHDMDGLRDRIRTGLFEERKDQKENELRDSLFKKYNVKFAVQPVKLPKLEVAISEKDIILGKASSPIKIVTFMDMECPYCENFLPKLIKLYEKYPSKILVAFKHFPLSMHRNSMQLAIEAECTKKSDSFYRYLKDIFLIEGVSDCGDCREEKLTEFGMTETALEDCAADKSIVEKIQDDIRQGKKLKITATPTTFINGFPIVGNTNMEELENIIESQLE